MPRSLCSSLKMFCRLGGGTLNARLNREAKSVRLSGTVVRVLPENDGLDLGIRRVHAER